MTKDEIMALADAYAQHRYVNGAEGRGPHEEEVRTKYAREALEEALEAALTEKQEPVGEVIREGVIKGADKYPPVGTKLYTHPAPVAKQEPSGWLDEQTGDYSRVNRLGWSALYLHPAPVNQQLLERAAQLACDAVAFNGGSVQMEAHVRAAIAGLRSLKEQEPVAWMCSNSELMHKGYQRFSATPGGDWNIPVYTHPDPSVNAQLLEALRGMVDNFCWGDMNDGEHAAIEVARAAIAAAEGKV